MTRNSTSSISVSAQEAQRFRPLASERWTLAFCTLLFAVLAIFVGGATVVGVAKTPWFILMLAPALAVIGALTLLVGGEAAAAFRLLIVIDAEKVRLRLPRRRGHVLLPATDETVPLKLIKAIETRSETFRQLGVVAIQQAYRLILSDGTAVDLGADRQFKEALFGNATAALTARAGIEIRNIGMVDGSPGILAAWGTSCPPWSTPSISDDDIEKRVIASCRALKFMTASITLVTLARLIARR